MTEPNIGSASAQPQEPVTFPPIGSSFKRVDFHVHTPGSADLAEQWQAASPQDVVDLALAAGLDVIVLADHNSVEWCGTVIDAARETRLVVLPGTEISTSEGHLLAIFDPSKPTQEMRDVLVRVGIAGDRWGDLNALADRRIDEVAAEVEKAGGLAIAAHVDAPKGFWRLTEATAVRRQEIYQCQSIAAVESHDGELSEQFSRGSIPGYPRAVASVQGSDCWPEYGDAHHLDAIGRRHCLVRLDEVTVHSLRQALLDPDLRLRSSEQFPVGPQMVILELVVSGGFLDGQVFRFNPSVNCLIGGTGAGKSLTLELIRFGLDQAADVAVLPQIAAETANVRAFGLGDSATVRIQVRKDDAVYLVERTWLDREGLPPVVSRIEGGEQIALDDVHVPSFSYQGV